MIMFHGSFSLAFTNRLPPKCDLSWESEPEAHRNICARRNAKISVSLEGRRAGGSGRGPEASEPAIVCVAKSYRSRPIPPLRPKRAA